MDTSHPRRRQWHERAAEPLDRARTLARWLDRLYLDPIAGFLVPGAGDILSGTAGLYLVLVAVRARAPWILVARMLINLTVDIAVGLIPFVGDAFDFVWRANERNLKLLEKRAVAGRATPADWAYVLGAALAFLAVLTVPILVVIWALRRAF